MGRPGAEELGQGGMARRPGAGSLQTQAEEGAGASPEPRERTSPADTGSSPYNTRFGLPASGKVR